MVQPLLNGSTEPEYVDEPSLERQRLDEHGSQLRELEDRVAELESQLRYIEQRAVIALLQLFSTIMQDIAAKKYKIEMPSSSSTATGSKWDAIKQRLQPRLRECVDLLLIQGHMKRTQIAAALKMDYSNCIKNVITILMRQGLLVDNGGELSLKEL